MYPFLLDVGLKQPGPANGTTVSKNEGIPPYFTLFEFFSQFRQREKPG